MEEMGKRKHTVPVIVNEALYEDVNVLMYAKGEGQAFEVCICRNEEIADKYMKEYERSGLFHLERPWANDRVEVIEPVVMLKTKVVKSVRKEFRVVDVDPFKDKTIEQKLSSEDLK